ncbi:hypothetical protein O181_096630 [Austropuccinia psidii MF-1]|uniref:Uncharacterized protein n=1 Tax=Austropuccinia psidii MF-1 TaxID=1389203 RepID=A0A9Q3J7Z9_9BASI|nr:hypothetical protein [Austropuccinia psidii MF-1]
MDPIQSSPNNISSEPPCPDIHAILMTILQSQERISHSVGTLKEDVDQLKLTPELPKNVDSKLSKKKSTPTEPRSQAGKPKISQQRAKSEPPPSILTPKKTSKPNSAKKVVAKPTPTPKRDPLQLQGKELPPDFKGVKEALFKHIRMLWDIREKHSLPDPPTQTDLADFYRKFSNSKQIKEAIQEAGGAEMNSEADVLAFARKQLQPVELGRGMKNLSQSYIDYIQGTLGRLGFTRWSPNLVQNKDDLYNVACRITAITTFQQLVAAGAYNHLSMNFSYIMKTALLQKAYDHYVHYLIKSRVDKEQKLQGSYRASIAKASSNTNRARLRNSRLDFAIVNKLPKRYRKIIEEISSHSDDEIGGKKNDVYVIRTLKYRSKKANIFFRKLDEAIATYEANMGITSR